jgi:ubiquinone/menaquinone biosynthesis C-methylase UbiE
MARKKPILLAGGLTTAFLLASAWRLYSQRSRERIPGFEELEDPEIAQAFNRVASMPQMRLLRRYVARRARALAPGQGQAVDLGCGPGHLVFELARQAPELRITGLDLSAEMLAEARRRSWSVGPGDRVSFELGDVERIPFDDNSLDLVVSTLSLHHWPEPIAVFDEIDRVLQPDGVFLIFDLRRDLGASIWLFFWLITHFVVPAPLRKANEPMGSRDAAYTPPEAVDLLSQSQLKNWRVTTGPAWLIAESARTIG